MIEVAAGAPTIPAVTKLKIVRASVQILAEKIQIAVARSFVSFQFQPNNSRGMFPEIPGNDLKDIKSMLNMVFQRSVIKRRRFERF